MPMVIPCEGDADEGGKEHSTLDLTSRRNLQKGKRRKGDKATNYISTLASPSPSAQIYLSAEVQRTIPLVHLTPHIKYNPFSSMSKKSKELISFFIYSQFAGFNLKQTKVILSKKYVHD